MNFDQIVSKLLEDFNILSTGGTPPNTCDAGTSGIKPEMDWSNPLTSVAAKIPTKQELEHAKRKRRARELKRKQRS